MAAGQFGTRLHDLSAPPRKISASGGMPSVTGQATRLIAVSGRRTHGVDTLGVGSGDLAEPVGKVDDGREEVDRLHPAEVGRDARDGGVIARLGGAQLRRAARESVKRGLQVARTQLRSSTALGRVLCEANLVGHAPSLPHSRQR